MSLLLGEDGDPSKLHCKCAKCALHGGKYLARGTWYNHNPGGKKAKLRNLSLEEINHMINLPAPKLTRKVKKRYGEELAHMRAHMSSQVAAGSSSVRIISDQYMRPIFMQSYSQRVPGDADIVGRRETTPELPPSTRPTDRFQSEETSPPAASNHENRDTNQQLLCPPSPVTDRMEEHLASPPPTLITNDFNLTDPPNDQEVPPLNTNPRVLPLRNSNSDKDPLPLDSGPDNNNSPSDADNDSTSDSGDSDSSSDNDNEDPPDNEEPPANTNPGGGPPASDSDSEDELIITLDKMKIDHQFITMAKEATLESQFSPAELETLQNPQEQELSPSDDPDLWCSIDFYISSLDHIQSQRAYSKSRAIVRSHFPGSNMLSYDQVKRRVSDLSGVVTWKHDMCINSCVGFTGVRNMVFLNFL
jgi:hypothetical protein